MNHDEADGKGMGAYATQAWLVCIALYVHFIFVSFINFNYLICAFEDHTNGLETDLASVRPSLANRCHPAITIRSAALSFIHVSVNAHFFSKLLQVLR
jgi:hypothetical protein